jgi:predicted ferric reductase
MSLAVRAVTAVLAYVGVVLAPLVFAAIGASQPGHGFWTNFSVALAFVGLAMMGLEFLLVARFKPVAAPFGQDALLQFHRQIGFLGLAFVIIHIVISINWGAILTFQAPAFIWLGVVAVAALVVLVITSVFRKLLRIPYEVWHILHTVLALVLVVGALMHIYLVHQYLNSLWKQVLWGVMSAAFIALLGWVRVIKPWSMRTSPWQLVHVGEERGETTTLRMKPPEGLNFRFDPGQFAWFAFDRSPFALTSHPFSLSSTAENGEVEIAVKALGDFTSRINQFNAGAKVYVDGPHGVFSMDQDEGPAFCFIGGGVGVTGLLSMLRTMADREDARPAILVYGNRDWESVAFRDEIERLEQRMNLVVVHVLTQPPADWTGETGYVDKELLSRHLPIGFQRFQYFICGPDPMMDATEDALLELGVPGVRVHTERFTMV